MSAERQALSTSSDTFDRHDGCRIKDEVPTWVGACPGLLGEVSLAERTSWRVGGPAEWWFEPADIAALASCLAAVPRDVPCTVLGLGSNVLIRDGGLDGLAVSLRRLNAKARLDGPRIRLEAGLACAQAARFAAREGLSGLEFFAGIPGTVGGALAMNAGAWGGETWRLVESVDLVTRSGQVLTRPVDAFAASYRSVVAIEQALVDAVWVAVTLRLEAPGFAARASVENKIRALLRERAERQPQGQPSCGSVFRNPPGDHAGRLIEAAGLKGLRVGGAWVSEKHANFIVHDGAASARDIETLITQVRSAVHRRFGVTLDPEVRILGRAGAARGAIDSKPAFGALPLPGEGRKRNTAVETDDVKDPTSTPSAAHSGVRGQPVVVLMGGASDEREVSLASGRAVLGGLKRAGVEAVGVDWDGGPRLIESILAAVDEPRPLVFLVLHGGAGEDGTVQACLSLAGLPYTGSGVAASAIGMDKLACKRIWAGAGLPVVPYRVVSRHAAVDESGESSSRPPRPRVTAIDSPLENELEQWLEALIDDVPGDGIDRRVGPWPVVVKPAAAGSSLGVHIVTSAAEWAQAVFDAARFPGEILVERYLEGREFTVGIVGDRVLPPVEIIVEGGFYDYDAKYVSDRTRYVCPPDLSNDELATMARLARSAFVALGASGWGRVDFLRDGAGRLFLLEINTAPGMTDHSLVPKAATAIGWDFARLCVEILATVREAEPAGPVIESASCRSPREGSAAENQGEPGVET